MHRIFIKHASVFWGRIADCIELYCTLNFFFLIEWLEYKGEIKVGVKYDPRVNNYMVCMMEKKKVLAI